VAAQCQSQHLRRNEAGAFGCLCPAILGQDGAYGRNQLVSENLV
jgi:hypothetical protein